MVDILEFEQPRSPDDFYGGLCQYFISLIASPISDKQQTHLPGYQGTEKKKMTLGERYIVAEFIPWWTVPIW
ncbi:hypothetical protein ARMGADRAFT_1093291 [Armillaria gallica]|uniref:Uncharacterized protein n=1 Tax=Armillaria gallica TaxID=47427 RepID=A0A2H3CJ66_ARMGA|nr:hypothetical protein ARMGADRAFT_1093337 [Armillaria gallica]PBK79290.1 hypothetical protein ARMGADRAFT_1093291 [Armillaria gallica]